MSDHDHSHEPHDPEPGHLNDHEHARAHDDHDHADGHDGRSHDDEHDHGHDDHGHDHEHGHDHGSSGWSALRHKVAHVVKPHSHEAADKVDSAMEASAEGMRTLWISLSVLGVTTVVQAVVVAISGSVSLLGGTIHNGADALTAVPLGIAFLMGRKAATRRFTYGFGRAEDLAGIAIVLTIAASSALAAYTAINRLIRPQGISHLPAVAVAAVAGFVGNEWVARYRIRTGRRIGSAALVADGLHARTDGFTSLAVLLGAGGAAIGWRWAGQFHIPDPVLVENSVIRVELRLHTAC